MSGNADHPSDGREDKSEDLLQALRKPAYVIVDAAENSVDEGNEGEKRNQHGGDVERELQAIGCSARNCAEQIFFLLRFFFLGAHNDSPGGSWLLRFRHE